MSNEISSVAARGQQLAALQHAAPQSNGNSVKSSAKSNAAPAVQYDPEEMRRNLNEAISHLNEQVQRNNQKLNFQLDEKANRFVITVKNSQTGEVVRQIPDEVVLKVAHNIEQVKGMLHNELA